MTLPTLFLTDAVIVGAIVYLLGRRFTNPQVRYISLPSDYFALFLLLGVVGSGIFMRYITKVDLLAVKECTDARFLPERYETMSLAEVNRRVDFLTRVGLGYLSLAGSYKITERLSSHLELNWFRVLQRGQGEANFTPQFEV